MQRISLDAVARQQLELAAAHGGRPAADTVVGGHERVLRQTVIGMVSGAELGEHNNPGEATVHVLRGRVRLTSEGESWEGRAGDLLKVPNARHSLHALEDSAVAADRGQAALRQTGRIRCCYDYATGPELGLHRRK